MKKIIVLLVFLNLGVLKGYCSGYPPYTITVINSSGGAVTPNQGFNIKDLRYNQSASCITGNGPFGGGPNKIIGHVEDGLNGGIGWMVVFSHSCNEITPIGHLPGEPVFSIKFYCYHICSGELQIQYDQSTKQFSILPSSTMLASDYTSPCSECAPVEINSAHNGSLTYSQSLTESDDWIKVSNLSSATYKSTVISDPNKKIKFDAKPPGFIELNANFIASPLGSNFFLAQIVDGCGPLQPLGIISIDQYACDSYTWPMNNITYTASGIYSYTNVSSSEEYELNLTLGATSSNNVNVTSCDSYTWPANGLTYTASGTYHMYSFDSSNCLQDEALHLNINTGTNISNSVTACDSYTWAANGTTYTTSGMYSFTSLNVNGCSQADILNLTIVAPIIITSTVTHVSCFGANNGSISSSSTGGSGNLTTLFVQGGVSSLSVSASCATFCANVCTTGLCWSGINNCWCFQPGGYPAALLSSPTNLAAGTYAIVVVDNITGCSEFVNLVLTQPTTSCNNTLSLIAYIQGYWNGSNAMVPVLMYQGQPNTSTQCDTITIELHNDITPYAIAYSTTSILNTNGTASVNLSIANGSYYIAIKHRNGLETWSANPVVFNGSPVIYNFTSAASQAYGANQIQVAPNVWALYSGDITSDNNIDLSDFALYEADSYNFLFGYLATDINGDGTVDLLDAPDLENNVNNFIYSNHP